MTVEKEHVNQELLKEWVAALRSGEYAQGKKRLNQGGKFCCLGVLCELTAERLQLQREVSDGDTGYNENFTVLPEPVAELIGFLTGGGGVWYNPLVELAPEFLTETSLAELNDSGFSFNQIADVMEYVWLNREEENKC